MTVIIDIVTLDQTLRDALKLLNSRLPFYCVVNDSDDGCVCRPITWKAAESLG
jgi:hypothetical protein